MLKFKPFLETTASVLLLTLSIPLLAYASSISTGRPPAASGGFIMDETTLIPTYLLIIGSILAAFIGAIVSSGVNAINRLLQRRRQRKALLIAITTDLVERFMRATMYYNQIRKGSISYSALYEATDPNTIVKLAEVIKNHDIMHTIVELKGSYYQIQRHVLEASKFAAEQNLPKAKWENFKQTIGSEHPDTVQAEKELIEVSTRAHIAQGRAIAFFNFEEMLSWTKTLIEYSKKHAGGSAIASLESKLNQRLEEKEKTDDEVKESESKLNQRL